MSTSTPRPLAGVLPVLVTPFNENEDVDLAALDREIDWVLGQGADGVVFAMVSEILRLTEGERKEVTARVCARAGDHGSVVVSVGAETARQAVDFATQAEAAGATALMAAPPLVQPYEDAALRRYFDAVIASTSLPLILQDASSYVGAPLSLAVQAELLEDYGADRIYFKPEAQPIGPNLSALHSASQHRARVFDGTGGIGLVDTYRRGIVGTMPGPDVCWAVVSLWHALEAENDTVTYEIAAPLALLISLQSSLDAFVAVEKYLLHKQGVLDATHQRAPVNFTLDPASRAEVDRLYDLLKRATEATGRHDGTPARGLVKRAGISAE